MDFMFWVWLGVIILTVIIEFATMDLVSIWFTFGAIIPFICSATNQVRWEIQVAIFVVISAALIIALRKVTKKFLLKNVNEKTNLDMVIGKQFRMLERTDFETIGSLKVNDVVWSAVGIDNETIEKGEIVEVVKINGNKMIVKKKESIKVEEKAEALDETKEKKQTKKKVEQKNKRVVDKNTQNKED